MTQVTLELQNQTADKLNLLMRFFGSKELMIDKMLEYHINRLKREIARMQTELDKYEEKYAMKTSEFYKGFEKGVFGDEKDYMLWAGIYELQLDSKQKLAELL